MIKHDNKISQKSSQIKNLTDKFSARFFYFYKRKVLKRPQNRLQHSATYCLYGLIRKSRKRSVSACDSDTLFILPHMILQKLKLRRLYLLQTEKCIIAVPSMTYAMKGSGILSASGIRCRVVKLRADRTQKGCAYGISVNKSESEAAVRALLGGGVRYTEVIDDI